MQVFIAMGTKKGMKYERTIKADGKQEKNRKNLNYREVTAFQVVYTSSGT